MSDGNLEFQVGTVQSQLRELLLASGLLQASLSTTPTPETTAWVEQVSPVLEALATLQTAVAQQQQQQSNLVAQHQALVQQYERDRQVAALAQRLRQSLDPAEILEQTVLAVQQWLQVDRVVIFQLKPDPLKPDERTAGELVGVAEALGSGISSLLNLPLPLVHLSELRQFCQQVGVIALDPASLNLPASATLPTALVEFAQQQQATALLAAPLRQEEALLGIISAHQVGSACPRVWQPSELELLQRLSTELAIALRQSQLYQQAQRLNIDLEHQVQQRTELLQNALLYESMLKRITDRVRDSLDETHILQAAVQELTVVLKLAGCNAALYDLNQGTSTIRYEYTQSIPTSQGRVAQMENFPEIYQQLQRGWYFQFCSLLPNPVRGRVAMLTCPIFVDPDSSRGVEQGVLGDLWLIHSVEHTFDEYEIRLVQQVANQCAIAIRQARLYQASQGQVQELAKLNRLKDEFLSTVSHELRTPITNIKMAIRMLRASATDVEKQTKYIGILEQETLREADLINDLLDLQQLQSTDRPVNWDLISLSEWLPIMLEPFQPRFAARQHQFELHLPADLPLIASEVASLRRILAELLNNACKYTAPGEQISLMVSYAAMPEESTEQPTKPALVQFSVRNRAEIPSEELPKIFEKFYRCPNADPWKQGGTGLGLALLQKLVERLQGTIQVTSADGWTTFTIKLPSPTPLPAQVEARS